MTITPLKQSDPRWATKKLGTGNIADRGCVVVCLAMLASTTPDKIVDEANFTSGGAILWASLKSLKFIWRGYTYENDKVLQAIKDYKGCLVEVSMPQAPGGKHWVLFIGDGKMNDPLTGKTESTSKYTPTGYCILEPLQTNNDTMPNINDEIIGKSSQRDKVVGHYKLDIGTAKDDELLIKIQEMVKKLEDDLSSERSKVKRLESELEQANKTKVLLEMDLAKENEKVKDANTKIFNLNQEVIDLKTTNKNNEKEISELKGEIKILKSQGISSDDCAKELLEQVIAGLEGYSGEKTLEGVLNSISQREAQREELKKRVAELEANPLIKIFQALKDLIR